VDEMRGSNYAMSEIAAAIGVGKFARLDAHNARRRQNAKSLTEGLRDLEWLTLPREPRDATHVYHQYTLRVPKHRDRLAQHLAGGGIGTRGYYPTPIHRSPPYRRRGDGEAP